MREEDEAGFCYFDLCSLDLPPRYLSNIVITVAKNLCNTCSEKQSRPSLEQRTVTNSQACHMHSHKTQTCQSRLLTRNRAFPEIVLVKIFVIFNVLFLHSSNCNLLCQAKLMHFISRNYRTKILHEIKTFDKPIHILQNRRNSFSVLLTKINMHWEPSHINAKNSILCSKGFIFKLKKWLRKE